MKLSPVCKKVYLKWINNPTWHTGHYLDKKRFYNFVSCYKQYSRSVIEAEELRKDIIDRYRGKLDEAFLEKEATVYSEIFSEIIEFLKVTRR